MTSNVIDIRGKAQLPDPDSEKELFERIASRNRLAQAVRAAAEAGNNFSPRDDRIWPAQTIDRLLREEGIPPRDLALVAGQSAISHLERVRLDYALLPQEAQRNQKGLSIRVSPYVQVLDAIAAHLEIRPDDLIAEAFSSTSFLKGVLQGEDGTASEIEHLLRMLTITVIRTEGLRAYFKQARETAGSYDPVTGDFTRGDRALVSSPDISPERANMGWEGSPALSWMRPPFPAVTLARVRRAVFRGPLLVERKVMAPRDTPVTEVARMLADYVEGRALGTYEKIDAEVRYHTDVRLAIGPTTSLNSIGPLFEVRTYNELLTGGSERTLSFPFALFRLGERDDFEAPATSVIARFDDGWRHIGGLGANGWAGDEELDSELFGRGWDAGPYLASMIGAHRKHEFPVYFEAVDPSTTAQLMRLYQLQDCQPLPFNDAYVRAPHFRLRDAEVLETIMAELQRSARELVSALDHHAQSMRAADDEEIGAMLRRWRRLGPHHRGLSNHQEE